jgi:hypothetical protein
MNELSNEQRPLGLQSLTSIELMLLCQPSIDQEAPLLGSSLNRTARPGDLGVSWGPVSFETREVDNAVYERRELCVK